MEIPNIDYLNISGVNNQTKDLITTELMSMGYFRAKTNLHKIKNYEMLKNEFLNYCKLVGLPISHDSNDSIVWDIKSNPSSKSFIKTYSEHSHEAELHTDSQYSNYPEDFFALLTLKKADCGGGLSYLLTLEDILEDLRTLSEGAEVEKNLRETNFPFIVPNVFKKSQESSVREFNFGPILRDNEIRFRVDTLEKAIKERPDLCSKDQLFAYQVIKSVILNSSKTKFFFLEDGDLIFINNKTMLHGRSQFQDEKRHLLRVRMNKFNAV